MKIPVLLYHKVGPGPKKEKYRISPGRFNHQMGYLFNKGYRTISPDDLLGFVKKGKELDAKSILLSFDDGYMDNFTYAYPILKRYGFKATIFLVACYIGKQDGCHRQKSEEMLSWKEIMTLQEEGFTFGCHTSTHPNLVNLSENELSVEIRDAKRILEEGLKEPVRYFAYPYGKFSSRIPEMVKKTGYIGAFSTLPGKNGIGEDPFLLRRILIRGYDTKLHFILNLKLGKSRI
jgi:peptidoglycan/xylan/chitin deacetylase (PgdA/CDA1 family)